MADQVSNLLQLVLQETGNNNNNWGVVLNQTLQKLEDAVTGESVLTLSGGTKVLTDDEQRPGILLLTGNLTSDAIIEVKPRIKHWIILDATTGAFTTSIRTNGNVAFVLPRASVHVWCDGATIREVGESGNVPVGALVWGFQSTAAQTHYLIPDGAAVSRSTYKKLFNALGTTFGAGDGSTTFNLPAIAGTGRFVRATGGNGGALGLLQANQLGSHGHAASSDTQGSHTHTATASAIGNHSHVYTGPSNVANWGYPGAIGSIYTSAGVFNTNNDGSHGHAISVVAAGDHAHTIFIGATGGNETRPDCISATPLIRYQ